MIAVVFRALLDFLFPPRCPLCGEEVSQHGEWCTPCLAQTLKPHKLIVPIEMRDILHYVIALGNYRGGLQKLITSVKYGRRTKNAAFVKPFLDEAAKFLPENTFDVAVPVPLHSAKEKQRGFNQAELIFTDFLTAQQIPCRRLIVRTRNTKPQFSLQRDERRSNLQDAFAIADSADVRGMSILLFDDIMTTGTTLYECAKVLHLAGAAKVCALVLASDRQ